MAVGPLSHLFGGMFEPFDTTIHEEELTEEERRYQRMLDEKERELSEKLIK